MKKRYKTRPCEIEAVQWNGLNLEEVEEFVGEALIYSIYSICDTAWEVGKGRTHVIMKIKTLEGEMMANEGDYIIKGLCGEFYPCKPEVFEKKYELIEVNNKNDEAAAEAMFVMAFLYIMFLHLNTLKNVPLIIAFCLVFEGENVDFRAKNVDFRCFLGAKITLNAMEERGMWGAWGGVELGMMSEEVECGVGCECEAESGC